MPISAIDGYPAEHWKEVKNILISAVESINEVKFEVNLVSDSDDSGIIQKTIVQNIFDSDIVICDVSAKNPNVMFELGMRLTFDKATIIVKDNITGYSFDTGIIEHISYPKDLRFQAIVDFKNKLAEKVLATYQKSINDSEYSTFLKSFGKFKVAKLEETIVPANEVIIDMLSNLQRDVLRLRKDSIQDRHPFHDAFDNRYNNYKTKFEVLEPIVITDSKIEEELVQNFILQNNINDISELLENKNFTEYMKRSLKFSAIQYKENFPYYLAIAGELLMRKERK